MTVEIQLLNELNYPINEPLVLRAAEAAIVHEGMRETSSLTIVFTSDEQITAMNRQFRGVDTPTDVLSFPAGAPPIIVADEPRYLGDLVIAYPYSQAQAEREGFPLDDILALLVVHGTLHLLGHDHVTRDEKMTMWAAQEAALEQLGISSAIVPALEE